MVYSSKFVLAILVDGVPQRENAIGEIQIPFGTEYEIRLRNKNNRQAKVQIDIDGENVSDGGYIVPANGKVDIKRYASHDARFKFVDLDSPDAVDVGKNGPNTDKVKGTIVAHFWLEKEQPTVVHHHHDHYIPQPYPVYPYYRRPYNPPFYGSYFNVTCRDDGTKGVLGDSGNQGAQGAQGIGGADLGGLSGSTTSYNASSPGADMSFLSESKSRETKGLDRSMKRSRSVKGGISGQSANSSHESMLFAADAAPEVRDGCTAEGGASGQRFTSVSGIVWEEQCVTLRCFLRGFTAEAVVSVQKHPTAKDSRLSDLERENEELRRKLAEQENAALKAALAKPKPPKKTIKRSKK
jgi:hypothetical protein